MQARRSIERAIRLFKKTREPRFGTEEEIAQATTDDIIAFAIEAYHVKDYVKKEDPSVFPPGTDPKAVAAAAEALFHPKVGDPSFAMAFTHDLCNATKHAELKRPKTHVTKITGMKIGFAHEMPAGLVTPLVPRENLAVTVYETADGPRFADDVMMDVLRTWIEFVKTHYAPGMATSLEEQMKGSWTKPELLAQTQAKLEAALKSGRMKTRPLPLATELPRDSAAKLAYWQALPELPIPDVKQGGDGKIYRIEGVEFIPVDIADGRKAGLAGAVVGAWMTLPSVRVAERDSLMRYRLPIDLAEPAIGIVGIAHQLGNPFPCDAEIGRMEGGRQFGGYYIELL